MSDNRTTELLREGLTKRGIEYQVIGKSLTYWNRDGSHNDCDDADFVADEQNGYLIVEGLTPEQAIAATLGSDRERALEKLVQDMNAALIHDNCYRWCEAKGPCNLITDGKCQYRERMKELGIEVIDE